VDGAATPAGDGIKTTVPACMIIICRASSPSCAGARSRKQVVLP
jgi:hypothetical protein